MVGKAKMKNCKTHTRWNIYIKNAPTCFDLIQIILKELTYFLLKSLILKFF